MKTLVMGWFSFEMYGATGGDLVACRLVCNWLKQIGNKYDIAVAKPFTDGVDWETVDPQAYGNVVFVCGPFGDNWETQKFLSRFSHCRKIGVNLTMLQSLQEYNPFDLLIARDSDGECNPDITFLAENKYVPVVGLMLVHPQKEYKDRNRHEQAKKIIRNVIKANEISVVPIDTRLDKNKHGLRTPAEIESLIARMDVILTTRLHGIALAIKNGVPPIAVDAISGSAKVTKQAKSLGWPLCFSIDTVTEEQLQEALDYCLAGKAKAAVMECRQKAHDNVLILRDRFVDYMINSGHE